MEKDLVIDLLRKIQESYLSFEDVKALLTRNENLLKTIMSEENFKSIATIVNSYKNDEEALKAVKIFSSVNHDNLDDSDIPCKKTLIFALLTNKELIKSGKVFKYVQSFLDIPDEKYKSCYKTFFNLLLDDTLIKQGLNFTFANFIIEHGYKSIPKYLEDLFTNERMLKELKPAEILNRALVITQASCQTHNNLSSMFEFFLLTKLDNEEMILNCARIIGDSSQVPKEICDLFLRTLPKHLSKCDYYFEAAKIIGTMVFGTGRCAAYKVIEADSNFEDKNTILLLRILNNCTFKFLGYGKYDVQYGNVTFRSSSDSIISDIKAKIIDTNYAYYYMLEKSVLDSKNDDINVSDLSVKLTRIKDNASKA